jgi:hypothetical protein
MWLGQKMATTSLSSSPERSVWRSWQNTWQTRSASRVGYIRKALGIVVALPTATGKSSCNKIGKCTTSTSWSNPTLTSQSLPETLHASNYSSCFHSSAFLSPLLLILSFDLELVYNGLPVGFKTDSSHWCQSQTQQILICSEIHNYL